MSTAAAATDTFPVEAQRLLPEMQRQHRVPGASLALVRDGALVWAQAFGLKDMANGVAVGIDTVFEAASLSKPVFAYAVLKLAEAGRLDLDTPLATYLDEPFIPDQPLLTRVTARHVLSHTSGMQNWIWHDERLSVRFTPGSRFSYSGKAFEYLQRVVERLTGEPLAPYMERQVLRPFAMHSSSYTWRPEYAASLATAHDNDGAPGPRDRIEAGHAACTLYSTPCDLARFALATMRPGPADDFRLSQAWLEEMLRPQVAVNSDGASWLAGWPNEHYRESESVSWGLGWGLQRSAAGLSFWHWGDNGPFKVFLAGYPERGDALVLMANGENGLRLVPGLFPACFGEELPAWPWLMEMYRET